mgnify:CR=1 FL=1
MTAVRALVTFSLILLTACGGTWLPDVPPPAARQSPTTPFEVVFQPSKAQPAALWSSTLEHTAWLADGQVHWLSEDVELEPGIPLSMRVVAFESVGLDQPHIGWHDLAERQPDDVAGHQIGDVHRDEPPVAADDGVVVHSRVQGGRGAFGAVFVDEAQADAGGQDDMPVSERQAD